MKKSKPVVHMPQLIDVHLLHVHPKNPQTQSRRTFEELTESIEESGFDENLIAVPRHDGQPGYWVISGNHRLQVSQQLQLDKLPVVVRDDWDDVEAEIQLVRRNYVRGHLDTSRFTELVNHLSKERAVPIDVIYERMGFENEQSFARFYEASKEKEKQAIAAITAKKDTSLLDHVSSSLGEIFEKYGHTVPNSFIVFPAGGKRHMFIHSNAATKAAIDKIVMRCLQQNLDINVVLGGLLHIGMENSGFDNGVSEELKAAGGYEGPDEIEFVTVGVTK